MELHLQENKLQSLDLEPLSTCTELVNLYTYDNTIQVIDITPLQSCMKFDVIDFGDAKLISRTDVNQGKWPRALKDIGSRIEVQ